MSPAVTAVRGWLRHHLNRWAADRGRAALLTGRVAPTIAVLAFHNVVPDDVAIPDLDGSLHIRLSRFTEILDALASLPNVRFPSVLGPATLEPGLDIHVTFDDAYRGAVRYALPALATRGIPATIFVAPELLGTAQPWWDDVSAVSTENRESWWQVREQLLSPPVAGRSIAIREQHAPRPPLAPDFHIATLDELRAAPGAVSFGCHSFSHACLPSLTDVELQGDLTASAEWLSGSGLPTVPLHAYPYGRFSAREERRLAAMGYAAGFRVNGGTYSPATFSGFSRPRINIPAGMTADGLIRRLVGPLA